MHPNAVIADEIRVIISDLEVIGVVMLCIVRNGLYGLGFARLPTAEYVANLQLSGLYPAFAVDMEGVYCRCA